MTRWMSIDPRRFAQGKPEIEQRSDRKLHGFVPHGLILPLPLLGTPTGLMM